VSNDSDGQTLTCQILLAHWFETTIGPIASGSQSALEISVRPSTGDVAILNSVGDHMAVERLICGETGADRAVWSYVSIDTLRTAVDPIELGCRLTDSQADCQFD
jgi:hypothetical protein